MAIIIKVLTLTQTPNLVTLRSESGTAHDITALFPNPKEMVLPKFGVR